MAVAGLSVLRIVSNTELARMEQEQQAAELAARQNNPVMLGLAGYLRACWDAAKTAKTTMNEKMLRGMRQRNGEYEADQLAAIAAQGGSKVYMMITEVKCRAAESWLRDILLDTGTPPWDIQPTPIPELRPEQMEAINQIFAEGVVQMLQQTGQAPSPQEMMTLKEIIAQDYRFKLLQEAQNVTDKMKNKIADQFAQGGWEKAFNDFVTDLVTFPAAIIKGPVVRRQRSLGWQQDANGKTVAVATDRIAPEHERVDPFHFYPEPGISDIDDGYCFQYHPMTRMQLADLIGMPGYDDQAIRSILDVGSSACTWMRPAELIQKEQEERKFNTELRPTEVYDALEFWGKVSGKMLIEWGMTEEEVPDEAREYDACVWLVGNYVIKAVLNYDPLGRKPYAKTSFIKCPGAFWGKGLPEILSDLQNLCNAAARSLVNNLAIASGPQVEINIDRVPTNEPITQMFPWKIWQTMASPSGTSEQAVRFFQPNSNAAELMQVYEKFSRLADDHSGIPAYLYGDLDVQGAGRTSSGLSMLMGSAGKGIRQVVMHIDSDVIRPMVEQQYIYNMRYDPDESIKGDVDILAKGAVNLATKETMNVRRIEFMNATANPIDMEIMGLEGRAAILREVAKGLQLDTDEIVPSREKAMVRTASQEAAKMQATQQKTLPSPTQPDGSPKGGMDGNTVMNRQG